MRLLLLTWFVIGFVVSVHFGCGRDGGQEEPLSIAATAPADLEVGVAIETKVRARLSADIDRSTLNADTFTLFELDGAQVPGTVEIDQTPDVAVFTPNEPLELLTIYAATITTGLASTDGRVLEEPFTWSFETLAPAWGVAEFIEENFGSARFPQVATDAEGNAFAVWQQSDGVGLSVWANRYTRSDLWGDAELIGLPDAGDVGLPQLAVDPSGVAHAIWAQRDPEDAHIYTSRYAPSNGN
jgi:hypothetical protein